MGRKGRMGRKGGMGRLGTVLITLLVLCLSPPPAYPAQQVPCAQASRDLGSSDPETRLRTVQLLREAGYPEAALPLARAVADTQDEVQLAAIGAELNIFLAEKVVVRKRVALVV